MTQRQWISGFTLLATAGGVLSLVAGCGGGSGGTSTTKLTGHFVDAPVAGLCYSSAPSGLTGVSNATGDYQYAAGDTVTFSVPTTPGNCNTNTMPLVAVTPKAPTTGDAQTFVLDVPNGQRVAEVLNALNHGSSTAMDVSGLTMPSAVATDLSAYIKTGATPSNVAAIDMLSAAQSATTAPSNTSYVLPVTASFTTSVDTHLAQSAASLPTASSGISLADFAGKLWFRTGIDGAGMEFMNSLSQLTSLSAQSGVYTQTLAISGSTFTLAAGTANETRITVNYRDAQRMLYSFVDQGSTVTGTLTALQPIGLADVAGKTLTFKNQESCNGAPIDMVLTVSADGASWQNQTYGKVTLTAAVDPAIPGLLKVSSSNANGGVRYLGLLKGSALAPGGKLAFVTTATGNTSAPTFGTIEIVANPTTAPVCSTNGGGSAGSTGSAGTASTGGPGNLFYMTEGPMTLTDTQVYLRYVSSAGNNAPGALAVLPKDYQLCVFADATTGQPRACGQVSDGVNAGTGGNGNFANQSVLSVAGVGQPGATVFVGWVNTATGAFRTNSSFALDANGNAPTDRQWDVVP